MYPHLVHIEEKSFVQPTWEYPQSMFVEHHKYDWSGNYFMHIWVALFPKLVPTDIEQIDYLNTTLGQVMRHVYYGSQELRPRRNADNDKLISKGFSSRVL